LGITSMRRLRSCWIGRGFSCRPIVAHQGHNRALLHPKARLIGSWASRQRCISMPPSHHPQASLPSRQESSARDNPLRYFFPLLSATSSRSRGEGGCHPIMPTQNRSQRHRTATAWKFTGWTTFPGCSRDQSAIRLQATNYRSPPDRRLPDLRCRNLQLVPLHTSWGKHRVTSLTGTLLLLRKRRASGQGLSLLRRNLLWRWELPAGFRGKGRWQGRL